MQSLHDSSCWETTADLLSFFRHTELGICVYTAQSSVVTLLEQLTIAPQGAYMGAFSRLHAFFLHVVRLLPDSSA
jgi:hypothetical protein